MRPWLSSRKPPTITAAELHFQRMRHMKGEKLFIRDFSREYCHVLELVHISMYVCFFIAVLVVLLLL